MFQVLNELFSCIRLAIAYFQRGGCLQMCFHKRKNKTFLKKISKIKRGEFMKLLSWVLSEPSVLSHGLIFHPCAIHISFRENIFYLKVYEVKGEKTLPAAGSCLAQTSSTSTTHLFFLPVLPHEPILCSCSCFFFFFLWRPLVRPCCSWETVSLLVTMSAWCISLDIKSWLEKRNSRLARADFTFRWSDDRKSYQHLTMIHCESAFTCRHTGRHTHISPMFICWTACDAGIKLHWNEKHSHL